MPCMALLCGCTHLQLQANTTRQAKTVSSIYEEQVLDNLAMFVSDPYATPFFAVPGQGTNAVNDSAGISAGTGFAARFWKNLSLSGSRGYQQNWVLNPVVAPNRLLLMQCAYQRAVGLTFDQCSQCCDAERDWNGKKGDQRIRVINPETGELLLDPKTGNQIIDKATGKPFVDCPVTKSKLSSNSVVCDLKTQGPPNDEEEYFKPTILIDIRTGKPYEFDLKYGEIIIPKQDCDDPCGITCGWVQHSNCWKDVPKCCCDQYGYHCGTYVWVDPCYKREFSKLVMKIVDYASGTAAAASPPPTKEVRFYFNADGTLGDVRHHATSITATVSGDKSMNEIERDLNISVASDEMEEHSNDLDNMKSSNRVEVESYLQDLKEKYPSFGLLDQSKMNTLSPEELETQRKTVADKLKNEARRLKKKHYSANRISSGEDGTARRDFGQPTQFNSSFGGSLLDMQQRLNAVTPR